MMDQDVQRRLAAILAADVAGYTRLMEEDTDGTVAAWKSARDDTIEPLINDHAGQIIKFTGDGFLVEFQSVQNAVACAIQLQAGLDASSLDFRIGINLGDIVDDGKDIHGDGVNIAARLEGLAEPGGIYISGGVYEQVRNRIDANFEDMGEQTVKHVSAPVKVYRINWSAGGGESPAPSGPQATISKAKPAVAVLPFDNMSGDSEQEYFADGITEDIITELSKWEEFSVIARNSVFTYKGQAVKVQDVARDLGADFVLEGSVRKSGGRVRITGQFIDAHTGHHVWADKIDESGDDLFDLQDRVTRRIVMTLGGDYGQIRKSEYERVWSQPASNLDEYDCFLRGHSIFYGFTAEAMEESRAIWTEGLARLPGSGLLKIKVAWTHIIDAMYGYKPDPVACLTEASQISEEGLADPNLPQAGQRYGLWQKATLLLWHRRDHANAMRTAKSVCQMFPFDGEGLGMMAQIANYCGDLKLAEEWTNESIARDPHIPEMALKNFCAVLYSLGKFEEAIEMLETSSAADPEILRYRAASLAALGRLEDARKVIDELMEVLPGLSLAALRTIIPYQDGQALERELEHLALAGLPEG